MSYDKPNNINLDNSDLYEYVMEMDQKNKIQKPKNVNYIPPKMEKNRKDSSINIILIVAIVLILLGLYCYYNKSNKQMIQHSVSNQVTISDDMLNSYYF